jgi:threonine/homoserine/homoserine lactone efflux protein
MEIVIKGILTGSLLSVFIGATFFMLIETSMTRGFRAALWFDLGVLACDALLIATVYFFTSWITRILVHNSYFSMAGGIAFVGFGINYIFSRRRETGYQAKSPVGKLVLNGFFINLLNPAVVVFWLGSMAVALSHFQMTGKQTFVYFSTTLGVVALFDVAKAYFAYRLSHFLNPRILRVIYVLSGVLMIGLGFYILFK